VILLTQHDEDQYVTEALRAGVKGYVLKSQAADDLVHAIREVCRGSVYLSPNISGAVVEAYLSKHMSRPTLFQGASVRFFNWLVKANPRRTSQCTWESV